MRRIVGTMLGPASAGKDTVLRKLEEDTALSRIVNDTTRAPRPGELDGVEYHFVSTDEYERNIARNAYATINSEKGRSYGVRWSELDKAWEQDRLPVGHFGMGDHENLWQMDSSGLLAVRSIFLTVPSLTAWRQRMEARVDARFITQEELQLRAKEATREYEFLEANLGKFAVVASVEGRLDETATACNDYLQHGILAPQDNDPVEIIAQDFSNYVATFQ